MSVWPNGAVQQRRADAKPDPADSQHAAEIATRSEARTLVELGAGTSEKTRLLLDGEWLDAADGKTFDSVNPATGEVLSFLNPLAPSGAQLAVNTIRTLSMDAVQAANSGHPGTPMALAPVSYVLWQRFLKYDPNQPQWPARDRSWGPALQKQTLKPGTKHFLPLTASTRSMILFVPCEKGGLNISGAISRSILMG